MNKIVFRLLGVGLLGLGGLAQGALVDAGNGLINDTTQNLVWTQDANLAATETFGVSGLNADGSMTWDKARTWIRAMNLANYKGYSDWRLWRATDTGSPGCDQAFSGTDCGWNIDLSTSELGHLWYGSLGNIAFMDTSGNHPQSGWKAQNFNKGPFTNLTGVFYWSGTEYAVSPFDRAWAFFTLDGDQSAALKARPQYGWAVRSGQVPVPAILPTGPIPITAEQAFDAVKSGCLPETPQAPAKCYGVGKVALVDVRTQEELDFAGGPGQVDLVTLKTGRTFIPDNNKAKYRVLSDGQYLDYRLRGVRYLTPVQQIKSVATSLLAKHAPCSYYDGEAGAFVADPPTFSAAMAKIAEEGVVVPITMCNSGGRSTQCPLNMLYQEVQDMFTAYYEIDATGDQYITPKIFGTPPFVDAGAPPPGIHMATLGGYSGSAYGGDYNGLIGFPGRLTGFQPKTGWVTTNPEGDLRLSAPSGPSVSWKDSGLPIYIPALMCILPQD